MPARRAAVLIATLTIACGHRHHARARVIDPPEDPKDPSVPLDPDLREGLLPNGLRYEILPVHGAGQRAQLRLVVAAGSSEEDDDQLGFAHVVEHLAFEGTRRFPHDGVTAAMERDGMAFGADVNASTSADATVYQLAVPTDEPHALDTALDIMRDWAGDVTFDEAALDRERQVVVEEVRQGEPGLEEVALAAAIRGSLHGMRPPKGDPDLIARAPRAAVVRFYRDWYRPDLMTVVVSGDIDAAAVE